MYFTKFEEGKEIIGKFNLTPVVTDFEADYEVHNLNFDGQYYFIECRLCIFFV